MATQRCPHPDFPAGTGACGKEMEVPEDAQPGITQIICSVCFTAYEVFPLEDDDEEA